MKEYMKDRTWFEARFKLNEIRVIQTVVNVSKMVSSFKFLTGKTEKEKRERSVEKIARP